MARHTERDDDAAVLGEGGPRADVGLCERVLHGGEEKADAAVDHGVVEAEVDGIFRMVVVVPGRRHVAGWWWWWWRWEG